MSKLSEAFELLGLEIGASAKEVEESWKRLRSEMHPDKNPDDPASVGRFVNVKKAYQLAIFHATKPKICEDCDGVGWTHVQRGWTLLKVTCRHCKGSGKLSAEE